MTPSTLAKVAILSLVLASCTKDTDNAEGANDDDTFPGDDTSGNDDDSLPEDDTADDDEDDDATLPFCGSEGLAITGPCVDATNPGRCFDELKEGDSAFLSFEIEGFEDIRGMAISPNGLLWVADEQGLRIWDVSRPASPELKGCFLTHDGDGAYAISGTGSRIYAVGATSLWEFDADSATQFEPVSTFETPRRVQQPTFMASAGDHVHLVFPSSDCMEGCVDHISVGYDPSPPHLLKDDTGIRGGLGALPTGLSVMESFVLEDGHVAPHSMIICADRSGGLGPESQLFHFIDYGPGHEEFFQAAIGPLLGSPACHSSSGRCSLAPTVPGLTQLDPDAEWASPGIFYMSFTALPEGVVKLFLKMESHPVALASHGTWLYSASGGPGVAAIDAHEPRYLVQSENFESISGNHIAADSKCAYVSGSQSRVSAVCCLAGLCVE